MSFGETGSRQATSHLVPSYEHRQIWMVSFDAAAGSSFQALLGQCGHS
jgi:hypothetical protein